MPGISAATFRGRRFFLAASARRPRQGPIHKRLCTILFSSSRCKMGCNCGRRAAVAAAAHQRPSVRRSGRRGGGYPAPPPPPPPPPPLPAVWGPPLWAALHTAAQFTTTESQRDVWIALLEAMRTALPCDECSAHYNTWIDAHPVALPPSGPDLQVGISTWILDLHNDVNLRKNVPTWTIDQVTATYTDKTRTTAAVVSLRPYIDGSFLDRFGPLL